MRKTERPVKGDFPLVSIIVPCYSKGLHLPEALESVYAQDYKNWELIVVNDGSPDDTSSITKAFASAHPDARVRLLEQENAGVSAARNAGLRLACGDYVMSLDADDKLHEAFLRAGVDLLRKEKANLFCPTQRNFGPEPGEWVPKDFTEYTIRYTNCIITAALYERALFEATGGYNVAIGFAEDWEYWVRCSKTGLRVCRSHEPLFHYRVSEGGLAATFIHGRYKDCMSLIAIANSSLYPVEEVLMAHEHIPKLSEAATHRLLALDKLHPKEWLLKFCLGLLKEAGGAHTDAMRYYWQTVELADEGKWQAFARLACLAEAAGQGAEAVRLYRMVHTLRPDMSRFVLPKIVQLGG